MKILFVATLSITINSFFKPHIEMLVHGGNQVDIACNYEEVPLDGRYEELGCKIYQVGLSRAPLSKENYKAVSQLKSIVKSGRYDIIHCHTPNASVLTRMICRKLRKNGTRVFYTAHGFHFYKGAPKKNWLLFYPTEKLCARFTDKLITINNEDYQLAKKKLKAKEVCYVPGVGVDLSRFGTASVDKKAKRQQLGIPEDARLLFSVGELNDNKNHKLVIEALARLEGTDIHYVVAGKGYKHDSLCELAVRLGVSDRVHFLGYRNDVAELYSAADIFCFPSIREGLSVALMEAMASKLPVICSNIRGNVDLINDSPSCLFDPYSVESCMSAIEKVMTADLAALGEKNRERVSQFSIQNVLKIMTDIYSE